MSGSVDAGRIAELTMDGYAAALTIAGADYTDRVRPWRELLRGVAEAQGDSLPQVLLDFLTRLQAVGLLDGSAAMWLLAAFHDEALA